jgi:hypothetical protein
MKSKLLIEPKLSPAKEARGAEQACEADSSRNSEGDLVTGLFWTRGEKTRSRK